MAKAKYTNNGNVKVTMTEDQFVGILALLSHVRLGYNGSYTNEISQFVIDIMDKSEPGTVLEEEIDVASDCVGVSIDSDGDFCIEFKE